MDINSNQLLIENVAIVNHHYLYHQSMDELVRDVRQMLHQDDNIVNGKRLIDDSFISKFIVSRGFDVKKASNSIRRYLKAKDTHPEIFTPLCDIKHAFESGVVGILPHKNPIGGETVLITRPGSWDPNVLKFEDFTAATALSLQVASMDSETQRTGIIDIIDMSGFGWKQLKNYGPRQAKRTAEVTEELMPVCFKEIHIINESYLARMAYSLVKSFLSEDFTRKIHFHGSDLTSLHKIVSKDILPNDLGGDSPYPTFDAVEWYNFMITRYSTLQDEWKRIGL